MPRPAWLLLPARSYDPAQGRFTSRDTANVFNHYQAFGTNPIINLDPTGHISLADLLIDIGMAVVFAVAAIATGGAAAAALPAVIGMEAGAVAASTVAFTVGDRRGRGGQRDRSGRVGRQGGRRRRRRREREALPVEERARRRIGTVADRGRRRGWGRQPRDARGDRGWSRRRHRRERGQSAVQDANAFLADPLEDSDIAGVDDPAKRLAVVDGEGGVRRCRRRPRRSVSRCC